MPKTRKKMFQDVPIDDEAELKRLARRKGLLMMGPDCGTAILDGVPLGFANAVRRGRIGLVGASGGRLKAGPTAIVASLDPTDGAKLDLGAVMATGEDAKALESFANSEMKVIAMVAQMKSLGPLVAKVAITSEGTVVRFRAPLTVEDVNQLLSVLDEKPASEQGSPPPEPPK